MSPGDRAELARLAAPALGKAWTPQAGPQTEAYFSEADLLLYGGAAGGGKSDLILGLALNDHQKSVIFRQQTKDVSGLEDRIEEIAGASGLNRADHFWRNGDQKIEFGHLEKPGAEKGWQGRPHDLIGFDEGAQISPAKMHFVMGWLRSVDPHQRCRVVIGSNPPIGGDGDYLMEWFGPWLDPLHPLFPTKPGELRWAVFVGRLEEIRSVWVDGPDPVLIEGEMRLPRSRTFIPAKLSDNAYLRDTEYAAQLDSMPEPMRTALKTGNFLAGREDHEYQVIPSDWIEAAMQRWEARKSEVPPGPMDAMGVDVAQGGKDKTTLARLYGAWFNTIISANGADTKDGADVGGLVIKHRRDGAHITVDGTGGWGGDTVGFLKRENKINASVIVFSSASGATAKDSHIPFANLRAEMFWRFREALEPKSGENICLPRSARLKAQLTSIRWKLQGQKILIESKDDIRARTGTSPDEADAVVMAWHKRHTGAYQRMATSRFATVPDENPLAGL
jgi:hypothetical protein